MATHLAIVSSGMIRVAVGALVEKILLLFFPKRRINCSDLTRSFKEKVDEIFNGRIRATLQTTRTA